MLTTTYRSTSCATPRLAIGNGRSFYQALQALTPEQIQQFIAARIDAQPPSLAWRERSIALIVAGTRQAVTV